MMILASIDQGFVKYGSCYIRDAKMKEDMSAREKQTSESAKEMAFSVLS